MFLTSHIISPNSSGFPTHNLCGQGTSIVSMVNMTFKLSISKDGINTTTVINTSNFSTFVSAGIPTGVLATYGDLDIYFPFMGFYIDVPTSTWALQLKFYKHGTTQTVLHEKIYVHLSISKTGRTSYNNVIEVYGYDIGNDSGLSFTGNPDFDIRLLHTSDNDSYGRQQNAFSACTAIRKPFSTEISVYNLVATQGTFEYYNTDDATIKYGTSTNVTFCSIIDLNISQKVTLSLGDTCASSITSLFKVWQPLVTSTSSCNQGCGDGCVASTYSATNPITVTSTIDWTVVTPINVDSYPVFPTEFLTKKLIDNQYDSSGILIATQTTIVSLTYATYIGNPSIYGHTIVTFICALTTLGDNVIAVSLNNYAFSTTSLLLSCFQNLVISACNWWVVSKSGTCGDYIFNNYKLPTVSSPNSVPITLSILNDDGTYTVLSTTTVPANSSLDIKLTTNGVYLISVPDLELRIGPFGIPYYASITRYYTIANFCNLEKCWLDYLNKTICCKPKDKCKADEQYDFFALMINAHSFFMMLNEEFNFNYIYSSLGDLNNRLDTLQTLSSFIKRFDEYCSDCDNDCTPCKQDKD